MAGAVSTRIAMHHAVLITPASTQRRTFAHLWLTVCMHDSESTGPPTSHQHHQPTASPLPRPTVPLKVQQWYLCSGETCSVRVTLCSSATMCTGCLWVQGGGTAGANASCARTSGRPAGWMGGHEWDGGRAWGCMDVH